MTQRITYDAKCTSCGQTANVPFKPAPNKPIYCQTCFAKRSAKPALSENKSYDFDPKQAWARRRWRTKWSDLQNFFIDRPIETVRSFDLLWSETPDEENQIKTLKGWRKISNQRGFLNENTGQTLIVAKKEFELLYHVIIFEGRCRIDTEVKKISPDYPTEAKAEAFAIGWMMKNPNGNR